MSFHQTVDEYVRQFAQIVEVDIDPLDESGYTSVCRGNAVIGINVVESRGVVVLISPIMSVPQESASVLFQRLLELNYLTTGDAAFAINSAEHTICLRALRGLEGMSFGEFADLLDTVATTADEWAEKLREEFGGDVPSHGGKEDGGATDR